MSALAAHLSEPWFIQLENGVPHQRVDGKFNEIGYLGGTGPEMLIPSLPLQAFSQVERITRHDKITDVSVRLLFFQRVTVGKLMHLHDP